MAQKNVQFIAQKTGQNDERGRMSNMLIVVLLSWASHLSGYPMPAEPPEIQFKSHEWFVEHACPTMDDCNVLAWYNDEGIVYIDESLDMDSGYTTSVLVHEFVHTMQDPDMEPCAREREAYAVQNQYIIENLATVYRATPKCS